MAKNAKKKGTFKKRRRNQMRYSHRRQQGGEMSTEQIVKELNNTSIELPKITELSKIIVKKINIRRSSMLSIYMSWSPSNWIKNKEQIEISGLYPITCITSFTKSEISRLLEDDIVLCKTISNDTSLLHKLNIPKRRQKSIVEQCHTLYKNL